MKKPNPEADYGKWILKPRRIQPWAISVGERDGEIASVEGLRTELMPHQRTIVKAMYDLERRRFININSDDVIYAPRIVGGKHAPNYSRISDMYSGVIMETCCGVLSAPFGSGKSFILLALITLLPVPKKIAEICSPQGFIEEGPTDPIDIALNGTMEIRRSHSKFMRQTVVFVSKSVLCQWEEYIKLYTDLNPFIIAHVRDLKKLHTLMFTSKQKAAAIDKYDIIIIKNGIISGTFDVCEAVNNCYLGSMKSKPIINVFGEMFREYCFARVIIDDFDVIGLPSTTEIIPALFTWFVSASNKFIHPAKPTKEFEEIKSSLCYERSTYAAATINNDLMAYFCIANDSDFLQRSIDVGKTVYFTYKFANPYLSYIRLLQIMNVYNIVEMINADAIQTAAAKVGLATADIGDIFRKLFIGIWRKRRRLNEDIAYTDIIIAINSELPTCDEGDKGKSGITKKRRGKAVKKASVVITSNMVTKLKDNLRARGPKSEFERLFKYKFDRVSSMLHAIKIGHEDALHRVSRMIAEIDVYLRASPCAVCNDVVVGNIYMLKCCDNVFCQTCVNDSIETEACMKCGAHMCAELIISINQDKCTLLSKYGDDADADVDADAEVGVDADADVDVEEDIDIEVEDVDTSMNKFGCVVKIVDRCFGDAKAASILNSFRKPSAGPSADLNVMKGLRSLPDAVPDDRKILIFSNYSETLNKLDKLYLSKTPYVYDHVKGSSQKIADIVRRFKLPNSDSESISLLLINSEKYCAGLNLQNATDMIFVHHIMDKNIHGQVIGRAVRVGRTNSLTVHYVMYENEFNGL